jgi:hypothetical protein
MIANCRDYRIELLNRTESLFLKDLTNCPIPSVLIRRPLHPLAQQQPIANHNTVSITFKFFGTNNTIIENSDRLIVTPYFFANPTSKATMTSFDRTWNNNLWREVHDCNCLTQNQKSTYIDIV